MATAAVHIPSYNRVEHGSKQLKAASYPEINAPPTEDVHNIATKWVESLNEALQSSNYERINQLFLPGSCWRDQLGLSWDYHTFNGPERIISFLKRNAKNTGPRIKSIQVDDGSILHAPHVTAADYHGKVNDVLSFLKIETDVGRGPGVVRLVQDKDGEWKAFTLFTAMHELKGHEETVGNRRPHGVAHGGQPGRKNWQERRDAMENFEEGNEPTVLILGEKKTSDLHSDTKGSPLTNRCWTGRPYFSSSSASAWRTHVNHRP